MSSAVMLEKVLGHIHNWFVRETITCSGCTIQDGELPASVASALIEGQWYRIRGSYLNDGLHQHVATDLVDETFDATIDLLAIPRPLIELCWEIADWQELNGAKSDSPYASESFGGYSYSLKSDSGAQNGSGGLSGWRLVFKEQLNQWRKIA